MIAGFPDEPASNWRQATAAAAAELATLVCRKCGAANRPGVIYVEITQNGIGFCTVCGDDFRWKPTSS